MNKEATIKDSAKTLPYRLKVYEVQVTFAKTNTIWYASKKGKIYHTVLSVKECSEGFVPVFRLVNISDNKEAIIEPAILLDIHPCDCTIISERILRCDSTTRYFGLSYYPLKH